MQTINRDQVKAMMEQDGARIVEVLDRKYFDKFHLPGAINVPLSDEFEREIERAVPDKEAPVVVYCMDQDCDASPKAARKMDELGYRNVFDYEAGKMDWKEAGLPVEA